MMHHVEIIHYNMHSKIQHTSHTWSCFHSVRPHISYFMYFAEGKGGGGYPPKQNRKQETQTQNHESVPHIMRWTEFEICLLNFKYVNTNDGAATIYLCVSHPMLWSEQTTDPFYKKGKRPHFLGWGQAQLTFHVYMLYNENSAMFRMSVSERTRICLHLNVAEKCSIRGNIKMS